MSTAKEKNPYLAYVKSSMLMFDTKLKLQITRALDLHSSQDSCLSQGYSDFFLPSGYTDLELTWPSSIPEDVAGGEALQYQMDTDVRLTLPKAGAFGENTISKNEGSLGEKPNFGSKLGGLG